MTHRHPSHLNPAPSHPPTRLPPQINEWLVSRESRWAWALLLIATTICYGGGLTIVAFSYIGFCPSGSCSLNLFFTTWSLVVLLLLVGVLLLPRRAPTAGLLTSGAVFLYCRCERAAP